MLTENNFMEYKDLVTPQWLAGFFDGEGCICCSLNSDGNVSLRVQISQKNVFPLLLIMAKYGGNLVQATYNKKGNKTLGHHVVWRGVAVIPMLELIKDFVIVKKDSVLAGLELAKLLGNGTSRELKYAARDKIVAINAANRDSLKIS